MNINSAQPRIKVGHTYYPVLEKYTDDAKSYDTNKDNLVTLSELTGSLGDELDTADNSTLHDMAVAERQHLIGQQSIYKNSYLSGDQINAKLYQLAAEHPDSAQVVNLGKSGEGRDILALRMASDVKNEASKNRPSVVVTGTMHAREWATNMTVLSAAEKVLDGQASEAMKDLELWFVPNINPDGLEYSREVDPMWRKNTHRGADGSVVGVDLNRNFPHDFRLAGDTPALTSDDKGGSDRGSSASYRGLRPNSEAESSVVKSLLDRETNALGLLDVHSYGEILILPDGEFGVSPQEYKDIAGKINEGIPDNDYRVTTNEGTYPVTGALKNYADSLGMVGMTMEIGRAFQPNPKELPKVVEQASGGVVAFVNEMERRAQKAEQGGR